jgi:hypothetical protein
MRRVELIGIGLVLALTAGLGAMAAGTARAAEEAETNATQQDGILTADERSGLVFMREEEKLAQDVYRAFYERWKLPAFNNIAWSEVRHMERIAILLAIYEIPDPVGDNAPGEFQDPTLKKLYDKLLKEGRVSLIAALQVGAEIEELDIADLTRHLAQTERHDISTVYTNLRRASGNHLRTFVSQLAARGVTHEPRHLSEEEYQRILADENGRGRGRGRHGGGGGWG